MAHRNWAGNLDYAARQVLRPRTVEEVRRAVAAHPVVKALGTRHSFSDLADTTGVHLDLSALDVPVEIDRAAGTVTLGAGVRYGELAPVLHRAGYALANLASLPHCTVAGSIATATHGSGAGNRNLAAAVAGLDLVTADGELRRYTRDGDPAVFAGLPVNLGALGVLTSVTLDLVAAFELRQDGYQGLSWDAVLADWDAVQGAGYSVSLFTRWSGEQAGHLVVKRLAEPGSELPAVLRGATRAAEPPLPNFTAYGRPGPWHELLPHFRPAETPSLGEELQSEYFVPRQHAVAALTAIRELGPDLAAALFVAEVRSVAGDELWLSPAHGGDRLCLHFTWLPRPVEVAELLPLIEARLAPFGVRPHWAKLCGPDLVPGPLYPELDRFRELAARLDPAGKFRNAYLDRAVLG